MEILTRKPYSPRRHASSSHLTPNTSRILTVHKPPTPPLSSPTPSSNIPSTPFPLLSLPPELQSLIYTHHFSSWSITLSYERYSILRSQVHLHSVPSMAILLVSKAVHHLASAARKSCFTGRLHLNSVFVLVTLRKKREFDWLKANVRILHFSDSSVRPERWYRYYEAFVKLERLEIDFPKVVRLGRECLDLESVLDGRRDEWLVGHLEEFVDSLSGELGRRLVVVVRQSFCLEEGLVMRGEGSVGVDDDGDGDGGARGWSGVLVAKIQLSDSCTQVLERVHDPGVDVISKQQFGNTRFL